MDTFSLEFRDWMDARRLKAADIAAALHIEPQTVRNWRASGIPARRQPQIAAYMSALDRASSGDPVDRLRLRPLIVDATATQYHNWEAAALAAGKTLTQWAADGLDEMAHHRGYGDPSDPPASLALVAEDRGKGQESANSAEPATPIEPLPSRRKKDTA